MMKYYIGIDIGTTGCKSSVYSCEGDVIGEAYIEYSLKVMSDIEIEQEPEIWWELLKKSLRQSIVRSGINSRHISAISISSQGISFLPVNSMCQPIYNAISWLDTRSSEQVNEILANMSEDEIYGITGKRVNAGYVLPKIMWIRKYRPEIYKKTYKFLMSHDFILARMTGLYYTDHTLASGTLMYDLNTLNWNQKILDRFDIDIAKLPEIKWSGDAAGVIKRDVAEELGLNPSVMVAVGAQDQKAAALGAGLNHRSATVSLGTAGAIEVLFHKPVFDDRKCIPCFSYVNKGQWVLEAVVATAGAAVKWARNSIFDGLGYREMDMGAMESPEGANHVLFYPHLAGATSPYWCSHSRGGFMGLSISTSKNDMLRSILEGISFQIKTNILQAEALGAGINTIQIFGGGSKSRVWCEMISHIVDKKVIAFKSPEIANLGAGILAVRGAGGRHTGFGERIRNDVEIYEPDRVKSEKYEWIYKRYIDMEKKILL